MIRRLLLAGGLVLLLGCGNRETSVRFEPEVPVSFGFRLPAEYDSEGEYPLVILLHNDGQSEAWVLNLWDQGAFGQAEFMVLAVRAPFCADSGFSWFKRGGDSLVSSPVSADRASVLTGRERILEVLDEFEAEYQTDPEWRFLVGFGRAAGVALHAGLEHPDVFQGIGAVVEDSAALSSLPEKLREVEGMDVFIALSRGRGERLTEMAQGEVETLEDAGVNVRLHLFEDEEPDPARLWQEMGDFLGLSPDSIGPLEPGIEDEEAPEEDSDEELEGGYGAVWPALS